MALALISSLDLSFDMYLFVGKHPPGHRTHACLQAIQNSWHVGYWGSAGSLRVGQPSHPIAPVESLQTSASFARAETSAAFNFSSSGKKQFHTANVSGFVPLNFYSLRRTEVIPTLDSMF